MLLLMTQLHQFTLASTTDRYIVVYKLQRAVIVFHCKVIEKKLKRFQITLTKIQSGGPLS